MHCAIQPTGFGLSLLTVPSPQCKFQPAAEHSLYSVQTDVNHELGSGPCRTDRIRPTDANTALYLSQHREGKKQGSESAHYGGGINVFRGSQIFQRSKKYFVPAIVAQGFPIRDSLRIKCVFTARERRHSGIECRPPRRGDLLRNVHSIPRAIQFCLRPAPRSTLDRRQTD